MEICAFTKELFNCKKVHSNMYAGTNKVHFVAYFFRIALHYYGALRAGMIIKVISICWSVLLPPRLKSFTLSSPWSSSSQDQSLLSFSKAVCLSTILESLWHRGAQIKITGLERKTEWDNGGNQMVRECTRAHMRWEWGARTCESVDSMAWAGLAASNWMLIGVIEGSQRYSSWC